MWHVRHTLKECLSTLNICRHHYPQHPFIRGKVKLPLLEFLPRLLFLPCKNFERNQQRPSAERRGSCPRSRDRRAALRASRASHAVVRLLIPLKLLIPVFLTDKFENFERVDGRRPTCKSCEDRKQTCRGYRRDNFVFLNEGWRAPGVAAHVPTTHASAEDTPALRRNGGLNISPIISPSDKARGSVSPANPGRPFLAQPLMQEPMALYVSFFLSEFSVKFDPLLEQLRHCFSRLINHVSRSEGDDLDCSPVIPAAAALVEGHFGKLKANKQIIRDNYYTYGRALRCMSQKLGQLQTSSFQPLNEDEWMDMVFSSSMLALWEVCFRYVLLSGENVSMFPNGRVYADIL